MHVKIWWFACSFDTRDRGAEVRRPEYVCSSKTMFTFFCTKIQRCFWLGITKRFFKHEKKDFSGFLTHFTYLFTLSHFFKAIQIPRRQETIAILFPTSEERKSLEIPNPSHQSRKKQKLSTTHETQQVWCATHQMTIWLKEAFSMEP